MRTAAARRTSGGPPRRHRRREARLGRHWDHELCQLPRLGLPASGPHVSRNAGQRHGTAVDSAPPHQGLSLAPPRRCRPCFYGRRCRWRNFSHVLAIRRILGASPYRGGAVDDSFFSNSSTRRRRTQCAAAAAAAILCSVRLLGRWSRRLHLRLLARCVLLARRRRPRVADARPAASGQGQGRSPGGRRKSAQEGLGGSIWASSQSSQKQPVDEMDC